MTIEKKKLNPEKLKSYVYKYRENHKDWYTTYQREYQRGRYDTPEKKAEYASYMKNRYYYKTDPLPSIRRLFEI